MGNSGSTPVVSSCPIDTTYLEQSRNLEIENSSLRRQLQTASNNAVLDRLALTNQHETQLEDQQQTHQRELDTQAEEAEAAQLQAAQQLQAYREALEQNANEDEERQQQLIDEANERREARQREVNAARAAATELRDNNECTDNQDIVRQHIERQRIALDTQNQLNIAENERQQRMAEFERQNAQQQERLAQQTARFNYAGRAQISVDFLDRNDENQNNLLPVNLPQSDNIDELSNSADITVNNVFTNHYNKNLTTYMDNRIKINDMKKNIDRLNSSLHKKVNKNITYGADGEMTFH